MKNFKSISTILLVAALMASCGGKDKKGMQNTDETPLVQVQSVYAEAVDETSDYAATVEAFKTNNIMSNTGNRIKRILVDVGSHVSAGQAVVILDNITSVNQESAIAGQRAQVEGQRAQVEGQRATVANQDAALASQEAALKTDEINIARQKKDLDRAKELVRIGGGTQQTVDQLQAAYDASLEALKARKRALEASKASLQASRTSLEASHTSYGASQTSLGASQRQMQTVQENTTLRSPISGVVSARNYDAGDLPGGPILTIQQLNPLKVVVSVNEEEFPKIRTGMPVTVTLDVLPGETFTGTVHLIHPEIDQTTRTFKVEVTIGNGGGRISAGMFARVKFNYGTVNHIVVPDKAIVKMQGSGIRYVFVLEPNGTVRYVEVKLGKRLTDRYEVLSGLSNGDKVVIAGQSRLTDGKQVKVQNK
jgi:RND family efflux transporter MFP subunit